MWCGPPDGGRTASTKPSALAHTCSTLMYMRAQRLACVWPQDRDIYLLENIFADADPSVAAMLMERVINGVLSTKTRVVVSSFAPCVAAAQRVITLEGGQAIHGAAADAPRHGHSAAPDAGRVRSEDERWQVRPASETQLQHSRPHCIAGNAGAVSDFQPALEPQPGSTRATGQYEALPFPRSPPLVPEPDL